MVKTQHAEVAREVPKSEAQKSSARRRLFRVAELVSRNPNLLTEGRTRSLIFNAEPRPGVKGVIPGNGLAPAIVRIGRVVWIDEEMMYAWFDDHRIEQTAVVTTGDQSHGD